MGGIMTVVFPSRMLMSSRDPVKILGRTCSGSGEVCASDNLHFLAVFSMSGEAMTSSMVVSVFKVKTLGLTFGGSIWQWRLPNRFLTEGIV
jgi:hypothetical protein